MADSHPHSAHHGPARSGPVLAGIGVLVAGYLLAAAWGWPQAATQRVVEAKSHASDGQHATKHDSHREGRPAADSDARDDGPRDAPHGDAEDQPRADRDPLTQGESAAAAEPHPTGHPPLWSVLPFLLLLGSVALMPLIPWTEEWWESNWHRFQTAVVLALLTLLYYLVLHEASVVVHWPAHDVAHHDPAGLNFSVAWSVVANAILSEYVPFIVLLFSLFTISGGIRIDADLPARPSTNLGIIGLGGLLASFIGTTGAAMLLIRPLLETNRHRRQRRHTVVFFIFVVCNCGGCLLPIGDPPLFLGYLYGVPFTWTFTLWAPWLMVNCTLLAVYYVWDRFWAYPREHRTDRALAERTGEIRFIGLGLNAPLLLGVVLSIALLDPSKPVPGTQWHAWMYLREMVQLSLVGLSLLLGSRLARQRNQFDYHAMIEVAALFLGIFICMQPALQILNARGPELGLTQPWQYFWATGGLSSMLDNAPTYVVFFETAKALSAEQGLVPQVAGVHEPLLIGVSLGAVFLGAMTYIGNGPNFMAKAIAETSGVQMPSFFGYMLYSGAILLPILIVTTVIFL